MVLNLGKKPVGLYVHIPFCRRKCSYCDFYSISNYDELLLNQYCHAVREEINIAAHKLKDLFVTTIFIGGGTPSLLSGQQLKGILKQIKYSLSVSPVAEITVEANPATIDANKMQEYLEAGVNRISLGAQSFNDDELLVLGRIHNAADILHTIEMFHKTGVKNFNLDLIYGIPRQSIESWEANLKVAIDSAPAHISAYLLQLGPQTVMARKVEQNLIELCHEDAEVSMYDKTIDLLYSRGFNQYEISNFSLPDYECRHNLIYWQGENYLGFGAGAVSYVDNKRYINKPELLNYIEALKSGKKPATEALEVMSVKEQIADTIILGLRLKQGINIEKINKRYTIDIEKEFGVVIKDNIEKGLLELKNGQLFLTRRGYFLSNQVLCHFIA